MRHSGFRPPLSTPPFVVLGDSQYLSAFKVEAVAGPGADVSRTEHSGQQHLRGIFRSLLPPDRVPHFQVGLPPSKSGCADGVRRFGLADLSVAAVRKPSVSLQSGSGLSRGTIADAVALREGRERSTMEGASRGNWGRSLLIISLGQDSRRSWQLQLSTARDHRASMSNLLPFPGCDPAFRRWQTLQWIADLKVAELYPIWHSPHTETQSFRPHLHPRRVTAS